MSLETDLTEIGEKGYVGSLQTVLGRTDRSIGIGEGRSDKSHWD